MDRRDQDVRGPVATKLQDQLGQVGLDRAHPARLKRGVQADLVSRQRLDLDELGDAMRAGDIEHDLVGFARVRCPVHLTAGVGDRLLELQQVTVKVREDIGLDRPAGLAELLPVGELANDLVALVADRLGRDKQV